MTDPTNHTYASANAFVDQVISSLFLSPSQASAMKDAHEIAFRHNLGAGIHYETATGAPVIDPNTQMQATDPAGFLRAMRRDRPELLDQSRPADKPPVDQPTERPAPKNLTEAMMAAQAGDHTAIDAYERNAGTSAPPTVTSLWISAMTGDPTAMAALDHQMKARRA